MKDAARQSNVFMDLLKRLVRVPKREIDEQERKYQKEREESTHKHKPTSSTPAHPHR